MTQSTETPEIYTIKQIAEILQLNRQTVAGWLKDGTLRGARLPSGTWRITGDELRRILTPVGGVDGR